MDALVSEVAYYACRIPWDALVQHDCDRHGALRGVSLGGAILEIRRRECQRLLNVLGL